MVISPEEEAAASCTVNDRLSFNAVERSFVMLLQSSVKYNAIEISYAFCLDVATGRTVFFKATNTMLSRWAKCYF